MTLIKKRKTGYYSKLWLYILICFIPIIFIGVFIINSSILKAQYTEAQETLWESITYGIENDCLRADYQGESTKLTKKNAEKINNTIAASRFVFYKKDIEIDADIVLSFGNGDTLYLYTKDNVTMLIQYVKSNGDENTFITNEITRLVTFERLISVDWGNSYWNE